MTNAKLNITDASKATDLGPCPEDSGDPVESRCDPPEVSTPHPGEVIPKLVTGARICELRMLEWKLRLAGYYAWARQQLPRAEWRRVFAERRLRIGIREAQMLCRIGCNAGLRWDAASVPHLPNNVAALYELSALSAGQILAQCHRRIVHPKLTTLQAKALVQQTLQNGTLPTATASTNHLL